ncbi:MAG: hypothetical protein Q4B27_00960 [Candidatus Saccharibacteria bacterium]|nr:hypothetical protein [Candidatus Saccharibacteria bacterium]
MILVNGIGSFLPIPPYCVRCGVGSVVVSNRINLHYSTKAAPAKLFLALFSHYFPHMYPCRTSGGYLDDKYIFFASILGIDCALLHLHQQDFIALPASIATHGPR